MPRVLVPYDFSPYARRACALAMQGFPFGSEVEIELLHVVDEDMYDNVLAREHVPTDEAVLSYLKDELTSIEAQLAVSNGAQRELKLIEPTIRVERGRPYAVIDARMREPEVVGVCLGGQGHGGSREAVLGRTAQRVIRHAECAVLVVKQERSFAPPTRLLASVDWSENSARALRMGAQLRAEQAGVLSIFHVIDSPYVPYVRALAHEQNAPEMIDQIKAEQLDRLQTFVKDSLSSFEGELDAVTESVVFGDPATSISAHVSALLAELVIVGARGSTDLSRYLLGSTAEKLVTSSKADILVVP